MTVLHPLLGHALRACAETPDRTFADIAADFDIDREQLQEAYDSLRRIRDHIAAHRGAAPQSREASYGRA